MHNLRAIFVAGLALILVACTTATPAPIPTPFTASATPAALPTVTTTASPIGAPTLGQDTVLARYRLPDTPLGALLNTLLPSPIANDRGLRLGSLGSDVWHGPTDAPDEFWMLTDRGPIGDLLINGETKSAFLLLEFTPLIVHVTVADETINILEAIPITGQSGRGITGLPNTPGAFDDNPSGMDTEALVRTTRGDFWVCEEYGPSLAHLTAEGQVITRYLPAGVTLDNPDYAQQPTLPAILRARTPNRGCESLALSPDESTLYWLIESPLSNPDRDAAQASRSVRLFVFDIASEAVVHEYVYVMDDPATFNPSRAGEAEPLKLSALVALSPTRLLALEHTDHAARVYALNLTSATDILDTVWDEETTTPSLELLPDLAPAGLTPIAKTLVSELTHLPGMMNKLEGLAVLDAQTLALTNDNDFGFQGVDAAGNVMDNSVSSRLIVVRLALPLK